MQNFESNAKLALSRIYPHKKVDLNELRQIDGSTFELNGVELNFDRRVIDRLNTEIGTTRKQLDMVRNASGEPGEVNFRNYLSIAKGLTERKEVVLIANPESRHIVNAIILQNDFIPIDEFFEFSRLFMEEAGYQFERMNTSISGGMEINIYMQSLTPTIEQFAKGEDTVTDGAFLQWKGDSIVLGNYYTRLVCSNGATETLERKRSTLSNLSSKEVRRMISLARSRELPRIGFETYREKALECMETFCSLRELRLISQSLINHDIGLTEDTIDTIVPLREYEEHFRDRGINIKHQEAIIKTGMTVWQLYNNLTNFASHTELLAPEDAIRHNILNMASKFLKSNHDIKRYIEYV